MYQEHSTRKEVAPDAPGSATGPASAAAAPGRTSRRRIGGAGAVLIVAGLLGSCTGGGSATRTATTPPPHAPRATASSKTARAATSAPVRVSRGVTSIAMPSAGTDLVAFGSVWVTNGPAKKTVTRLDPRTDAVIARIRMPHPPAVVTAGAGALWVTSYLGNSLTRIDPGTNRPTRTISLAPRGTGPIGVTVFRGFVWVANHDGEPTTSVSKIEPATMRMVDVIPVGAGSEAGPAWILSSAGSIWTNPNGNSSVVVRIDPRTDRIVATIRDPSACTQLAADDTGVWGACPEDPTSIPGLSRIDARTNRVTATFKAAWAGAVALDHGSLWFATGATYQLGRIDTRTNKIVCLLNLPGPAFGLTAGAGAIWTTDRTDGLLFKVIPAHACPPRH